MANPSRQWYRYAHVMSQYFHQPDIDPVLIHIWGPFQIRWYSLLFVGGFLVGRYILRRLAREERFQFTPEDMDQFTMWLLVGAVIGARIIYCFVYDPESFFANPLYLFQIYKGGLSFHGGLLGTIVAGWIFAKQKKIPLWNLLDAMSLATPSGLAMGRMGNFINGELWGRVSYVPWAVIFKHGGPEPRHPSQLYELFLEGIVLFSVLWLLKNKLRRDGELTIVFLIGYSLSRFIVEFFRQPDPQLGFLIFGLSMGQILSILMFLASAGVGYYRWKQLQSET
ncbi:MAG: prolipoprotein diacylglyceryl transferase [Bdellovibrionaceae bacterium]|nr:prolipoprotein diacylglyceryl transferase [Pseudobdellovibrionaceae bacterium]